MNRKLQKELAEYFEAPCPTGKRRFLRQLGAQKISVPYMVWMQARYISKWVWLCSALFCVFAVALVNCAEARFVNAIYGCVPFLVMLTVTESTRSYRCGMEELELAARFSLKSIVMARMIMLGLGNLVVLLGACLMPGNLEQISLLHLFTPYFITAGGGLCIARKMRGNEGTFLCFALAALVCGGQLYLPFRFGNLFAPEYAWIWMLVCGAGILSTCRESYRTIRMAEELAWN